MEFCRAGLGPPPACRALPKIVSSTCCGCTPARSSAAFAATTPISTADSEASEPPNLPIGVRTAERMYTWFTEASRTYQSSSGKSDSHWGHREHEGFPELSLCSPVLPVVKKFETRTRYTTRRKHSLRKQYG